MQGAWTQRGTTATRALGLLERRFELNAHRNGMADSFMSFVVRNGEPRTLNWRIALAWSLLRSLHPSLCVTSSPDFTYSHPASPLHAYSLALDNILLHSSHGPIDVALRRFINSQLINGPRRFLSQQHCLARLILVRADDPDTLGIIFTTSHIVRRRFVVASSSLRRFPLTRSTPTQISDGQSTLNLCQQFIDLLSSPLPTPLLPSPSFRSPTDFLSHVPTPSELIDTPHTNRDTTTTHTRDDTTTLDAILREWNIPRPLHETMQRLPLATETLYPPLPLSLNTSSHLSSSTPIDSPTCLRLAESNASTLASPSFAATSVSTDGTTTTTTTTHGPTLARRRWFWAISKVLVELDAQTGPRIAPAHMVVNIERDLPSVARQALTLKSPDSTVSTNWPLSQWEGIEYTKEGTQTMLRFCRVERISPSQYSLLSRTSTTQLTKSSPTGMMLYGILSVALSNLHQPSPSPSPPKVDPLKSPKNGILAKKTKVVIGLPLSLRPFLVTPPSSRSLDSPPSSATDMAIRIGFGNLILDVLPSPPSLLVSPVASSDSSSLRDSDLARNVVANARLAKVQFNEMFATPGSKAAAIRVSKLSIYLAKLYWSHHAKILYVPSAFRIVRIVRSANL